MSVGQKARMALIYYYLTICCLGMEEEPSDSEEDEYSEDWKRRKKEKERIEVNFLFSNSSYSRFYPALVENPFGEKNDIIDIPSRRKMCLAVTYL